MTKVLVSILAGLLIIAGFAGLLLPIVPGWVLILVGIILLGEDSRLGRYIHEHLPAGMSQRLHSLRAKFSRKSKV